MRVLILERESSGAATLRVLRLLSGAKGRLAGLEVFRVSDEQAEHPGVRAALERRAIARFPALIDGDAVCVGADAVCEYIEERLAEPRKRAPPSRGRGPRRVQSRERDSAPVRETENVSPEDALDAFYQSEMKGGRSSMGEDLADA